ncbi:hypothetical protein Tco_0309725 [Tanacetum coccineum]
MKGKYVETKFEKSFVIRQLNAFKSQRQSILGKPAIFSDSLAKKDLSKSKPITTQNVSNDFSKPVTTQILPQNMLIIVKNTNVIAPGLFKVHTKPNQTRTPQLHQDIREEARSRRPPTRQPMAMPISTREPKQYVNQFVATFSKKTVATDSTVKKSRNITRKLYEQVSKTCSWWYPKFTPPGYNWKPKSQIGNVNPKVVSMPLGNASRTTNFLEHKTPRCSTVSNTPLSSNSFVARMVKFGNDQIAPILGYVDLVQGAITIKRRLRMVENLDKMKKKGVDIIFVGYSTQSKDLQDSLSPGPQSQENVPQVTKTVTTSNELELLYSLMFSELLNGTFPVVHVFRYVHAAG